MGEATGPNAGDEIGGATLAELLDGGTQHRVWRGDVGGAKVAVHVLGPSASEDDAYRFHAAALKMLKLSKSSPAGVLRVRSVVPDGRAFVTDLWTVGRVADLPALAWGMDKRLALFGALCGAVETVHAAGLVHGGLAPASVQLDDDLHPIIAAVEIDDPATVLADPARARYVAPELDTGGAPTIASDVYALGRILHFLMLDRDPPLETEELPRLDDLAPSAPAGLVRIVRKCTSASAARRYASVADLVDDVARHATWDAVGVAHPNVTDVNTAGTFTPGQRASALPEEPRRAPANLEPRAPASAKRPETAARPAAPLPSWTRVAALAGALLLGISLVLGYASGSFAIVWRVLSAFGLAATASRLPIGAARVRAIACAAVFVVGFAVDVGGRATVAGASTKLQSSNPHEVVGAMRVLRGAGRRKFTNANVTGGDLSGLELDGADCDFCDFTSANLSNASFARASLIGATMRDANLEGTVLTDANVMMIVDFDQARCNEQTKLPSGWRCDEGHPRQ